MPESAILDMLRLCKEGYRLTLQYNATLQSYELLASKVGRQDYDRLHLPRVTAIAAAEQGTIDEQIRWLLGRIL